MPDEPENEPGGYVSFPGVQTTGAVPDEQVFSTKAVKSGGRRMMVRFLVVFVLSSVVALSLLRLAIPTTAYQYYLCLVGQHTSALLNLFGQDTTVERPLDFADREADVRASLRVWQGVGNAETGAGVDTSPLTAWEAYQYRTYRLEQDIEEERHRIDKLALPKDLVAATPEEHITLIRQLVNQLREAVTRPGPGGPLEAGPKTVREAIPQMLESLDRLEQQGSVDYETYTSTLDRMNVRINGTIDQPGLRQSMHAFLTERMRGLEDRKRHWGPHVFFMGVKSSGDETKEPFAFTIVPECGAAPLLAVFVAAVVAFPCLWWKRLVGVAAGLPVLYVVNLARLALLGYLGAVDREGRYFSFTHEYVWQGLYVLFVVLAWMMWVTLLVNRDVHLKAGG